MAPNVGALRAVSLTVEKPDAVGSGAQKGVPFAMTVEAYQDESRQGDNTNNLIDTQLWGAAAIGGEINQTERQAHYLLSKGLIKSARRIGGRWTARRSALRKEFGAL